MRKPGASQKCAAKGQVSSNVWSGGIMARPLGGRQRECAARCAYSGGDQQNFSSIPAAARLILTPHSCGRWSGPPTGRAAAGGLRATPGRVFPRAAHVLNEKWRLRTAGRRAGRVYAMTKQRPVTRRSALKLATAATALPLVHIRTAGAAGKLSLGLWDHWVPGANDVMKKQVDA